MTIKLDLWEDGIDHTGGGSECLALVACSSTFVTDAAATIDIIRYKTCNLNT